MKRLLEFINEALLFEEFSEDELKKARAEVMNALNDKADSLESFIEKLNVILKGEDSNANTELWLTALKQIFDGSHGKGEYKQSLGNLKVTKLYPTQTEIDIINSAKWITDSNIAKTIGNVFTQKDFGKNFPVPVLVYKDNGKYYIIDGHHRWSQVGLLNRNGSLYCLIIEGPESAKDFLKITQGVIASVIAAKNGNNGEDGKLPVGKARPENNIFGEALEGDKLTEKIVELLKEHSANAKLVYKALKKQKVLSNDGKLIIKEEQEKTLANAIQSIGELVTKNRDKMIEAKQTPEDLPFKAADRKYMPQTDAGGPDGKKSSAKADGSALKIIAQAKKFPEVEKGKKYDTGEKKE